MDQSTTPQAVNEVSSGAAPVAHAATTYQPDSAQQQLAFQQVQQFHQQRQQQQQQLQTFWANQMLEIEQMTDFKNHSLPLARIKKIMKADEDVRMISAEAPVVFGKACELFILELTLRAWTHTEESKRRILQKNDIAVSISRADIYDFLVDIIPSDDLKDENLGIPTDSIHYYYMPPQHQVQEPGIIMGPKMDQTAAAAFYAAQQTLPVAYMGQQPQGQSQEQHPRQFHDVPDSD